MIHTESCTSLAESSFLSTAPGHQADDAGAHRHLYLDREAPGHMLSVSVVDYDPPFLVRCQHVNNTYNYSCWLVVPGCWGLHLKNLLKPHFYYPLVNCPITMENHLIFNGKIHYFYGHVQLLYVKLPEGSSHGHPKKPKLPTATVPRGPRGQPRSA